MSRKPILPSQSPSNNGRSRDGEGHGPQNRRNADAGDPEIASPASGTPSTIRVDAPAVIIVIPDGTERRLTVEDIPNDEVVEEIIAESQSVVVDLDGLLGFGVAERLALFALFEQLGGDVVFRAAGNDFADMFAAILELIPSNENMEQFATAKSVALQVAALKYPGDLEAACDRIVKKIRTHGITGYTTKNLVDAARDCLEEIEQEVEEEDEDEEDGGEQAIVRELFPAAPVSDEAVFPFGWDVSDFGICRTGSICQVAPVPVCLTARGMNEDTDEEIVVVAWLRDGQWKQRVAERAVIANARNLVELSAFGFPVTSNTAKHVVDFLADYETANLESLPMTRVSDRLGFCEHGFLWGNSLVTNNGVYSANADNVSNRTGTLPIIFRGRDEGDEQLAAGFHSQGNFSAWKKAIAPLRDYPKAKLGFYTAFVPPMLHILNSSNFAIDFAGMTSTGKTTVLRVAASVWGNPDERKANGRESAIATWESTGVWRERAPSVINNLPFVLDDTKRARKDEDVSSTAYTVAQGRGKGRGTVKGTARSGTFQTVLLSSGEQPMTSFTNDGGTRARVLTLWGSPFEATDTRTARLVQKIDREIKQHYGHAGPLFVQYLLKKQSTWGMWRKQYRKWLDRYLRWAANDPIAGRMAAYLAAISVTAFLVHQALVLPWAHEDPIGPLWNELVGEVDDPASAALRHVMEWASAHQEDFWRPGRQATQSQPHQGWAGRWEFIINAHGHDEYSGGHGCVNSPDYTWVGFIPACLKEVLRQGGFEPESTIRTWGDRGWLHCTEAARNQLQTRLAGNLTRMVAITAGAVQNVENG